MVKVCNTIYNNV